jgi:hypothetical protein
MFRVGRAELLRPGQANPCTMDLLCRRRVLALSLHVLLYAFVVLGKHVSDLCFLSGIQQLINLGADFRVLDFHLDLHLGVLCCNCSGLGLVEIATGDQLHHLLVGLELLLHQGLHVWTFGLHNLLYLGLLIVRQIQLVQHHAERAAHELMVHSPAHAVVHSSGATFLLGEGESGDKRKRHSRQQRILHDS